MPGERRAARPRSLADDLRRRDDDALAQLLLARPDLASPNPVDLASLAARAGTRASAWRALTGLDAPSLVAATALTVLAGQTDGQPVTLGALATACATSTATMRPLLTRLLDLGLAFGSVRAAQPVRILTELFGPYPAGLGPSAAELLQDTPGRLHSIAATIGGPADPSALAVRLREHGRELLDSAPPGCLPLLHRLDGVDRAPVGALDNARRELDPNLRTPVDWLLARGLLIPLNAGEVVVPREVSLALRGAVQPLPTPPDLPAGGCDPALVERVAPGAASEVLRQVGQLLTILDDDPAAVLRAGGIGVRDLNRLSRAIGVDPTITARLLVVAAGANLISVDDRPELSWRPTSEADEFLDAGPGRQWAWLIRGWTQTTWSAALAGTRDERNTVAAPLSANTEREVERRLRVAVLGLLPELPADAVLDPAAVTALLGYRQPRGPVATAADRAELLDTVLAEAGWLGLLAFGGAPGYAREVAAQWPDGSGAGLDAVLPPPIERVHLLPDLTAVAPGPLTRRAAALLESSAEVESRGGATVFRFSPTSVARALDTGLDAEGLLAALAGLSEEPELPQPLEYLVRDTARRHGRVRVGRAGSYLRSDDPDALTELLSAPAISGLGWHRLAPTVVAATTDVPRTLELVQRSGVAAVEERLDGSLVVARTTRRRAEVRDRFIDPARFGPPPLTPEGAQEVVALLRQVEASRAFSAPAAPTSGLDVGTASNGDTVEVLRSAARQARPVLLEYANAVGQPVVVRAQPVEVTGGVVRLVDLTTGGVTTVGLHRLRRAQPLD